MYFILETKEGKPDIVKNFEDAKHLMVNLIALLKQRDIAFYEKEEDIKEDGVSCIKVNSTKFKVIKKTTVPDGYLFSGHIEYNILYTLDIIYYSLECYDNKELCQNIKVCNHTQKQKRVGSLEKLTALNKH